METPQALPELAAADRRADLVVIGAGIVGVATALQLQCAGRRVLLLDRSGLAAGASRGNAGAFAYSDVLPLASPGIVRQAPRWLLDPLGPLTIRPRYAWRVAPWLWRFVQASRPDRVAASSAALVELMRLAAQATPRLLAAAGALDHLREDGNLHLYDDDASWSRSLPGWELRARCGIEFRHLAGTAEIEALQPGLAAQFRRATFVPRWQTADDPLRLVEALARALAQQGGVLRRAEVAAIEPRSEALTLRLADGSRLEGRQAVVCAGPWSQRLATQLGDDLPLEAEGGYNTTLPRGAFELRRQLTFCDHGFVMTPIGGGVRVGGAVEFAGLGAAPNFARAQAMLAKARRFVPGLRCEGGVQWMGYRPSLPDSLPVIGSATRDDRVFYAFGHGHSGLTQAAATAELVAALASGAVPAIDLAPFAASRFARGIAASAAGRPA